MLRFMGPKVRPGLVGTVNNRIILVKVLFIFGRLARGPMRKHEGGAPCKAPCKDYCVTRMICYLQYAKNRGYTNLKSLLGLFGVCLSQSA